MASEFAVDSSEQTEKRPRTWTIYLITDIQCPLRMTGIGQKTRRVSLLVLLGRLNEVPSSKERKC